MTCKQCGLKRKARGPGAAPRGNVDRELYRKFLKLERLIKNAPSLSSRDEKAIYRQLMSIMEWLF